MMVIGYKLSHAAFSKSGGGVAFIFITVYQFDLCHIFKRQKNKFVLPFLGVTQFPRPFMFGIHQPIAPSTTISHNKKSFQIFTQYYLCQCFSTF